MKSVAYTIMVLLFISGCMSVSEESKADLTISESIEFENPEIKTVSRTHEIVVRSGSFEPAEIEVNTGDVIIWRSADDKEHRIVLDGSGYSGDILTNRGIYEHVVVQEKGEYMFYDSGSNGFGMIIVS